jgi:hypothetical protein
MVKILSSFVLLILLALFSVQTSEAKTKSDILGISLGMSYDEATRRLQKIGKLEKNESKLQEIWTLNKNASFSHLIVGFDKETKEVRFVTAKALAGGKRVKYEDVLDTKKAKQAGAVNNYKYIQEIPAQGKRAAFKIIAMGQDSNYLTYFSIEKYYK